MAEKNIEIKADVSEIGKQPAKGPAHNVSEMSEQRHAGFDVRMRQHSARAKLTSSHSVTSTLSLLLILASHSRLDGKLLVF